MSATTTPAHFVNWFRDSTPYIHTHRNKTFVIFFNGQTVQEECDKLIHDFALLKSLGIRLVLIHGIRPQIDQRLKLQQIVPSFHNRLRITDSHALQCVKEAAGLVRVEIEALLSMGLSNSPMAGAKIKVASGNFVTAKPLGIIDGIDYQHTGQPRRIDHLAIHQQLDQDNVVLISPIGYSATGEVFNLAAKQVATEVAIALQADKLILLTDYSCTKKQSLIQQMTVNEVQDYLQQQQEITPPLFDSLTAAIKSCQQGVQRIHLIDRKIDGALLLELFTRDGTGTLISSNSFEEIRSAHLDDIGGILELIKPLEQQGLLIKRSREKLEIEIGDYIVIERDGLIIGCIAFHLLNDKQSAEIACLAIHVDYQNSSRGSQLLDYLIKKATSDKLTILFVLSTQTMHWFIERGFKPTEIDTLPKHRQEFYNYSRNSKVLYRSLK